MRSNNMSKVFGISATHQFWEEVDKQMAETGMSRSAVLVESCLLAWRIKIAPAQGVGRPRKKTVKR